MVFDGKMGMRKFGSAAPPFSKVAYVFCQFVSLSLFLISYVLYIIWVGKGKGRGIVEEAVKEVVEGAVRLSRVRCSA